MPTTLPIVTTTTTKQAAQPPACEQGWVLTPGSAATPGGLYVVGDIYEYEYAEKINGVAVSNTGLCTYQAPPAGLNNGAPPCPDKGTLTYPEGGGTINGNAGPGQLWELYWDTAYPSYRNGGACTYIGP